MGRSRRRCGSSPDDGLPLHGQIENAEYDIRIYEALSRALSESGRVMGVFATAADPESAVAALGHEFGFDEVQCRAVMEAQFRRATIGERRKIEMRLRELTEELEALRKSR